MMLLIYVILLCFSLIPSLKGFQTLKFTRRSLLTTSTSYSNKFKPFPLHCNAANAAPIAVTNETERIGTLKKWNLAIKKDPVAILSIPIVAGLVGYITNYIGVKMLFYPLVSNLKFLISISYYNTLELGRNTNKTLAELSIWDLRFARNSASKTC